MRSQMDRLRLQSNRPGRCPSPASYLRRDGTQRAGIGGGTEYPEYTRRRPVQRGGEGGRGEMDRKKGKRKREKRKMERKKEKKKRRERKMVKGGTDVCTASNRGSRKGCLAQREGKMERPRNRQ
ncbi:hypothetical protein ASPWEDRAFT_433710 [Aspergillus wentii DTO 134E9]|uniref:Uncharacterized protein n=1 Tax=Aspergillus wentii DTO 134E9 TaxID=1073089 RepID=A0A1L9RPN6_ASPWE|nr:uncharacterized protein ASPWEDRAFT_433710 [Aspergillus wentii DTO 134E9]OJJ36894.1 hypothetical protein ASPWEDRAFT_433710 [Aspergillus wentii DTO 134E9]